MNTKIKNSSKQNKMKMTSSTLTQLAGLSAVVAGMGFVVVGMFHPVNVPSVVTTATWISVHIVAVVMGFFGLLGMVGLYARQAEKSGWQWLVPAGLLLLSAIPLIAGALRLVELAGGAQITPANARFFASPLPVIVHIVGAIIYAILGVFQLLNGFRRRFPRWHRVVGRILVLCGLLVGLSGIWMTLFYPRTGYLLFSFRLLFGSAMVLSIVLGYVAIRQGDVTSHRAWMMRAYAIGLGAGTQVLTQGFGEMIFGPPTELGRALMIGAGWMINLAVAEWVLRRRRGQRRRMMVGVIRNS